MPAEKDKTPDALSGREIVSARLVNAPRELVWKIFAEPEQLARWWGPKGFTNTFHEFDLRPGGRWRFTMHAPDGASFENDKQFTEVTPPARVVFRHFEVGHGFEMTLSLVARGERTEVTWRMLFDAAADCAKARALIVAANEENFNRLESHLSHLKSKS